MYSGFKIKEDRMTIAASWNGYALTVRANDYAGAVRFSCENEADARALADALLTRAHFVTIETKEG